ncbi:MAG TPA: penicillin-binding transpeptidase domain-containing protein [Thermoanaerobaculia bacterium]|nr:penicillin-binding transpeptidase domain-containing protein [Thermoanaerobaculia bacterium]
MPISQKRLIVLFAILAAWAVVVIARLVQVQLIRHADYSTRALRQQERILELTPVRGSILDSHERVLAESVTAESIYADPQAITDAARAAKLLAKIPALQTTAKELRRKLEEGGGFVWIARQFPVEAAAEVKKLKIPGIYSLEEHRRSYPRQTLASNVIGYAGLDGQGLAGIEHSFDSYVRGHAGRVTLLRDARRGMYLVGGEGPNKPVDGNHVVLTIDSVVQFIAERSLSRAVDAYHAASGSAIVLDPSDGAILAMASEPAFDPNHFRDATPASQRNHAVQDMFEPGSTFKIVTASAGLEEGLVTPSQILDCGDGSITIGTTTIHEHGHMRYGMLSFEDVMVHSSNVGAIRVGLSLGPKRFYEYIRRFGFGERTGVQLPGETPGLVRRTEKWSQVSNASISMGQEIGATPLQITRAFAAVANGGLMVEPRIVDRVIDANGKTIYKPQATPPVRVISEKTAAVLNEILKQVVARGTGANAALAEHIVAGKTGTAQKAGRGGIGYLTDKYVASFGGYVPADRPRLVILVLIDEPKNAQYGGTVAAPVFKEIAEATLRYLGVPPTIPSRTIGIGGGSMLAGATIPSAEVPVALPIAPRATASAGGTPDLRGLDAREAIARAVGQGLAVRVDGSGTVISQEPAPGLALPADKRIVLHLAASESSGRTFQVRRVGESPISAAASPAIENRPAEPAR